MDESITNKKNFLERCRDLYPHIKHTISGPSARIGYVAMLDHAVYGGTTFVISILLARFINPTEFGAFVLVFSIMLFAKGIQTAVITEPMVIIGAPKDDGELHGYVSATAAGQVVFGGLSAAFFYGVYHILKALGVSQSITNALLGLALAIFFIMGQEFFRRILFMRTKPGQVFMNDVIFSLLQLSGIYMLYSANSLSAQSAFWAIGIGAAIAALLGIFQCRQYLTFDFSQFRQTFKTNWKYGRWVLAAVITFWTSGQAYFFIAAFFLGPIAPAVLKACQNILAPMHIFLMSVDNIAPAIASRKFSNEGLKVLNKFLRSIMFLLTPVVVFYSFFIAFNAKTALGVLYKDQYIGYGNIVAFFSVYYIISSLIKPFVVGLRAIRKPEGIFYAYSISTIITVLLSIPLIMFFEISGAAMGMILSITIATLVSCHLFIRYSKSR